MFHKTYLVCLSLLFLTMQIVEAQAEKSLSIKEILQKSEEVLRGTTSSHSEMSMTIVRPDWSRELSLKSWTKGEEYALILITGPARDKGTAFLKREKEMWNWQPTIERVVKLPPSMMSQSWMGSDFTNDDLVRQASVIDDYDQKMLEGEEQAGYDCYKIELIPHEEVAVVWGKVVLWITKEDFLQVKTEFYDEDDYLVNTMTASDIKEMGGKLLPARMEIVPAEEEGNKTIIVYKDIVFDENWEERFFSVQNMKRIK